MPEVKPTCPKCGDIALDWHVNIRRGYCGRCKETWSESKLTHLRSTVATLRKALEHYQENCRWCGGKGIVGPGFALDKPDDTFTMPCDACKIATTALEETKS